MPQRARRRLNEWCESTFGSSRSVGWSETTYEPAGSKILFSEPSRSDRQRYGDPDEEHRPGGPRSRGAGEETLEHRARVSEQRRSVESHQQNDTAKVDRIREHEAEQRTFDRVVAKHCHGGKHKTVVDNCGEQPHAECDPHAT